MSISEETYAVLQELISHQIHTLTRHVILGDSGTNDQRNAAIARVAQLEKAAINLMRCMNA